MTKEKDKNGNLADPNVVNTPDRSNMPDNQMQRHRSNNNNQINKVKSDAGFLSREVGEGDFGSEEARADPEKGNDGHAGNMPNSVGNAEDD